jgi:hypothetical protein
VLGLGLEEVPRVGLVGEGVSLGTVTVLLDDAADVVVKESLGENLMVRQLPPGLRGDFGLMSVGECVRCLLTGLSTMSSSSDRGLFSEVRSRRTGGGDTGCLTSGETTVSGALWSPLTSSDLSSLVGDTEVSLLSGSSSSSLK